MSADKVQQGDTVTYCGETFKVSVVAFAPAGMMCFAVEGSYPRYVADFREVEVGRPSPVDDKPYVVLTRDYSKSGKKDVRRFAFKTKKAQQSFMDRTKRCITFSTN